MVNGIVNNIHVTVFKPVLLSPRTRGPHWMAALTHAWNIESITLSHHFLAILMRTE